MTDEEMLPLLCLGGLILMIAIVIALLLLGSGAFTYRKRTEGQNTVLRVTARRNIARICLVVKVGNEDVTFERKRIKKGQSVDFAYPATKNPGKLTVEVESGNARVVEV
jgi:hypothetical protein